MHKVYSTATSVWEAQLQDISRAQNDIYYEQYVHSCVTNNRIGQKFIDALVLKSNEGVRVHCIFDALGSFELFNNTDSTTKLDASGIHYFFYKTVGHISSLIRPLRLVLRDHRKLLIIDDTVFLIGGVVVEENMNRAQDLMVRYDLKKIVMGAREEYEKQLERLQDSDPLIAPLRRITEDTLLVGNAPGIGNRFCYERICHAIMLAETSVTIVTPYFAPPFKLRRIIQNVIKRGVQVTLVISHETDNTLADIGREPYIYGLVKAGMKLKYNTVLNHSKIVLVDDTWLTFGSTNIDILSLFFNHELNIETTEPALVHDIVGLVHAWCDEVPYVNLQHVDYATFPFYKRWFAQLIKYGV